MHNIIIELNNRNYYLIDQNFETLRKMIERFGSKRVEEKVRSLPKKIRFPLNYINAVLESEDNKKEFKEIVNELRESRNQEL